MEGYSISTYVINLPERTERLQHVLSEFSNRDEFDVKVFNAIRHEVGAQGLWNSIVNIVQLAIKADEDLIIICEDDHQFTEYYSKDFLFMQIEDAYKQNCDILAGGISGGFSCAFPVSRNRFWVDGYFCNQFIVIFKKMFHEILSHKFDPLSKVDLTLSSLTPNKMVIFPFISVQKFFGYSDVTKHNNNENDWVINRFEKAESKLRALEKIFYFYYR